MKDVLKFYKFPNITDEIILDILEFGGYAASTASIDRTPPLVGMYIKIIIKYSFFLVRDLRYLNLHKMYLSAFAKYTSQI